MLVVVVAAFAAAILLVPALLHTAEGRASRRFHRALEGLAASTTSAGDLPQQTTTRSGDVRVLTAEEYAARLSATPTMDARVADVARQASATHDLAA
jgi:hypothetical protein